VRHIPFIHGSDAVAKYYQAADIYLHASLADTFPNSVIEAQACGVPTVASAIGGIPEQLVHESTGLLVPPRDASAMARSIERLLDDEETRAGMARQAANRAKRIYDLRHQVNAYLEWYAEILERHSR